MNTPTTNPATPTPEDATPTRTTPAATRRAAHAALNAAWGATKTAAEADAAAETLGDEAWARDTRWTGGVHVSRETGLVWFEVETVGEHRWWADTTGTGFPWRVLEAEDPALGDAVYTRGH